MSLIRLDTSDPSKLLEKKTFDPVPAGKYVLEVENDLKVEPSKSSAGQVVKIEFRILDDGPYKGRKVFDNLVIGSTAEEKKKTDWKIAQFAIACGVCTKDTLHEIDLAKFKGTTCEVDVGVKTDTYQGQTRTKNIVKQYLFEAN